MDDFDKNTIRQKVHSFWFNHEIPTLLKILTAVNEDETLPNFKRLIFQKVLKDLKFVYVKKCRNSALLERDDIVNWRRSFLDRIRHYRQQNRPIYYLDETWVHAGETTSVMHSSEVSPQDKRNPQAKANDLLYCTLDRLTVLSLEAFWVSNRKRIQQIITMT